jgi:hypothetical protein
MLDSCKSLLLLHCGLLWDGGKGTADIVCSVLRVYVCVFAYICVCIYVCSLESMYICMYESMCMCYVFLGIKYVLRMYVCICA